MKMECCFIKTARLQKTGVRLCGFAAARIWRRYYKKFLLLYKNIAPQGKVTLLFALYKYKRPIKAGLPLRRFAASQKQNRAIKISRLKTHF